MLAKISGIFRLTRDAELRYANNGTAILKLGLACSEKFKEKETKLFLDAVAFGKSGEILHQYAGTKGTQLYLNGKLETQSWDKDGVMQYKNSMTIESFEFIGSKKDNQTNQAPQQGNYQQNQAPQSSNSQANQQQQKPIKTVFENLDPDSIPF